MSVYVNSFEKKNIENPKVCDILRNDHQMTIINNLTQIILINNAFYIHIFRDLNKYFNMLFV